MMIVIASMTRIDDSARRASAVVFVYKKNISSKLIAVAARFEGVFARDVVHHAWPVHRVASSPHSNAPSRAVKRDPRARFMHSRSCGCQQLITPSPFRAAMRARAASSAPAPPRIAPSNSPPSPSPHAHALLALASSARSTRNPRERALANRPHRLARAIDALVRDYASESARARALRACAKIISTASARAPFARCAQVLVSGAIASCARRRGAVIRELRAASLRGVAIARELERFADANAWMAMELDGARGEDARALAAVKRALGGCEREGAKAARALALGKELDDDDDDDDGNDGDDGDDRNRDDCDRSRDALVRRGGTNAVGTSPKRMRIRAPSPAPTLADDDDDDDDDDVTATTSEGHTTDNARDHVAHVGSDDGEVRSGLASPSPTLDTQPLTDSESPDIRLTETSPTIKSVVRILMDMDNAPSAAIDIGGDVHDLPPHARPL
jgi:hypothetical protein